MLAALGDGKAPANQSGVMELVCHSETTFKVANLIGCPLSQHGPKKYTQEETFASGICLAGRMGRVVDMVCSLRYAECYVSSISNQTPQRVSEFLLKKHMKPHNALCLTLQRLERTTLV